MSWDQRKVSRVSISLSLLQELLEQETAGSLKLSSTRKKMIIFSAMTILILSGAGFSLKAPFFVQLAQERGIESSIYGIVIASSSIGMFINGLFLGSNVYKIGARFVAIAALPITAIASAGFGSIDYIQNDVTFVILGVVWRIVEGVGVSSAYCSLIPILSCLFPESAGVLVSLVDFSYGLGIAIGPFYGGMLIDASTFMTPFLVTAGLMILFSPVVYKVIPAIPKPQNNPKTGSRKNILKILSYKEIFVGIAGITLANTCLTFQYTTLEPHLEVFNFNNTIIGVLFGVLGLMYAVGTLACGQICDRGISPYYCIMGSSLLLIIGMSILGPIPWIPLQPHVCLAIPGIILIGLGTGSPMISSVIHMRNVCFSKGHPDDETTNGIMGGIHASSLGIGSIIGSIAGGFAFDLLGFRKAQFIFLSSQVCFFIFVLMIALCSGKNKPHPAIYKEGCDNRAYDKENNYI